ncbi:riboflavin synthase subunit alpha [Blochmannia endosymbiont of Colobopsis nipponica]|uniref:riboflavin synthase subunit alpha n=1 Tax=Blochmannia endosymbiont of Colobopsis nipponica TaxID=2681987 RepID=UPI00177D087B|nr:riboflavin synthase subunit alpha [Blochmannia endosymbiont of Colobopsis nipponica]QOI11081.1 riboflavin synthase subunit alpha [Blochmannia endosymbiont of Colobopsis nipponica]
MFTGIIKTTVPIVSIIKKTNFHIHTILLPKFLLQGLELGSSISYNGCCLTVSNIQKKLVSFDIIKETLKITNLKILNVGNIVNLERAIFFNKEIGGHLMYGQITCTATLRKIIFAINNRKIWFEINKKKMQKYLLYKGSIGIDGVSLTICKVIKNYFCVALIPKTLEYTTLGNKKIDDIVNIEIDIQTRIIINTAERMMSIFTKKIIQNNSY